MTSARAIEYRITQQLIEQRKGSSGPESGPVAERVICVLAASAALLLLGSLSAELLWVAVGSGAVLALGTR
jgi:hypothetical protein